MAKVKPLKIFIDPYGNTMTMWWDDPEKEYLCDETEHSNDVLIKNRKGKYIGFEKIVFFPTEIKPMELLKNRAKFLLEAKKRLPVSLPV